MTFIVENLVGETTSTSGTGSLTLAGAVTGCRTFASVCANNDTVPYSIGNPRVDAEWEVGIGTWQTGGTLVRTTILSSSNAGSVVSLPAGVKYVQLDFPAELFGYVKSGATLPVAPVEGQQFLHTPTGRTVLMMYAAAAWRPIRSYGSMTLYVNGSSGSDSAGKGYGTGANAYATIQYAVDSMPGTLGGNVTVSIAAGTYAENVVIQGKSYTGAYSITLTGTRSTLDTLTSSASTQGSGSTQGTVVRSSGTWTSNQRRHKLIRFTSGVNSGVTRLIDSNDTTTLTIVEVWPGGAPGSDSFVVEDWATFIAPASGSAMNIGANQININLVDICQSGIGGSAGLLVNTNASAGLLTVQVNQTAGTIAFGTVIADGQIFADTCFFINATEGDRVIVITGTLSMDRSKIVAFNTNTNYNLLLQLGGIAKLNSGNILEGTSTTYPIRIEAATLQGYTGNAHHKIRTAYIGISASYGGIAFYTASGVYIDFSGIVNSNTSADSSSSIS